VRSFRTWLNDDKKIKMSCLMCVYYQQSDIRHEKNPNRLCSTTKKWVTSMSLACINFRMAEWFTCPKRACRVKPIMCYMGRIRGNIPDCYKNCVWGKQLFKLFNNK